METSLVIQTPVHIILTLGEAGRGAIILQNIFLYKCYDNHVIFHIFLIPQTLLNILSWGR